VSANPTHPNTIYLELVMDCDCGEFRMLLVEFNQFASVQIQGFATRDRQKFTLVITNSVHAFECIV
jgi:hypothetical protein